MNGLKESVQEKIAEFIDLCKPKDVVVCNGSQEEHKAFLKEMVTNGVCKPLKRKGSFYFRSDPKDVARVESCTFICSKNKDDAGPTNNYFDPFKMKKRLNGLFEGCMEGRTMYIIPYLMGPSGSSMSKVGIEVTDSLYVCVNMYIMSQMGEGAAERLEAGEDPVLGLHSVGMPLSNGKKDVPWPCNEEKLIAHFPETREIYSYGSGYGGNALLGKKCFALRIASVMASEEGWLAEHMLIIGVTNPKGKKKYFAAAFPSACGKTNLAMLEPELPGWKVECVGDDIAWMKFKEDGKLYAINPENGFFGVAPGTSEKTNPSAMKTIEEDTLFTNVALCGDDVWWEGMTEDVPMDLTDWKGNKFDGKGKASHPNARFTAPVKRCPTLDENAFEPEGVPIEGIIFGGRRAAIAPLVMEAKDWTMGTLYGASLTSEKTAAAEGVEGELRSDPFAMLPFCGYNMADYFRHWLSMEKVGRSMPKIFSVNWFRKDEEGDFIWPGYSANMNVLAWMFDSIDGNALKTETPYGYLPKNFAYSGVSKERLQEILTLDPKEYSKEIERVLEELEQRFGKRLPLELSKKLKEQIV